MLATIRDDTWNVHNMQHLIPNSKDGIIQTSPMVAINRLKYPPTWLKVATTLEKPPTPPTWLLMDWRLSSVRTPATIIMTWPIDAYQSFGERIILSCCIDSPGVVSILIWVGGRGMSQGPGCLCGARWWLTCEALVQLDIFKTVPRFCKQKLFGPWNGLDLFGEQFLDLLVACGRGPADGQYNTRVGNDNPG